MNKDYSYRMKGWRMCKLQIRSYRDSRLACNNRARARSVLDKAAVKPETLNTITMTVTPTRLRALFFLLLVAGVPALYSQDADSAPVYVVPIRGEINPARMVFVRRSIQKAEAAGARFIIFEIDTFGGRVDSALQITTLIGSVADAETIAYVPSSAEGTGVSWSAGALISFSCDRIYMAPGTSIGAAAPVYQTQAGMEAAPEKTVSAVRAQMAALAEKNGYPVPVARAMVDDDVELLEVYLGEEMRLVARDDFPELEREAADRDLEIEEGRIVSASGKLLTLTAGQMARYGISSGTVGSLSSLYADVGVDETAAVILEETPADRAAAFVTGAAVSAILIIAGLVALYLEITSPGFGVPGTVAIVCFAVVFLGSALLGTVGSLELLMFLAGVVLLVVEIFLIPGFGIIGIAGLVLMAVSLVLSRQGFIWPEFEWEWDVFRRNLSIVGVSVVSSLIVFGVVLKAFPRLPLFNRLILSGTGSGGAGGGVGTPVSTSSPLRDGAVSQLAGKTGVVITALRPVGKIELDGEIWEAQSDGEYLAPGTAVEVVETRGNRIFVGRAGR